MEHRGTVEWNGCKVVIEGPAEFVSTELERFRSVALGHSDEIARSPNGNEDRPINEAAFLAEKMPSDHMEKIAVLAVKMKQSGKAEFTGDDMRRAYLRAGIKPPKVMGQALVDAKRHRDFIEPTTVKGVYRLTDHGADYVTFDLPRKVGASK
jgi:hypothetical protein